MLIAASISYAFELDCLKSGMSLDEAKQGLKNCGYEKIKIKQNNVMSYHIHDGRFINLNFCKGKLVQVQKDLNPQFDNFVRLVHEKRRELGKPLDAWSKPTDVTSNLKSEMLTFLWKDGKDFVKVEYCDFGSNAALYIMYEIRNKCWETP